MYVLNNVLDYILKAQSNMMYFCKIKSLTVCITNLNNLLLCPVVLIFKYHMKGKKYLCISRILYRYTVVHNYKTISS